MRSNYLAAGLVLNTAYNDNVLAGGSTTASERLDLYNFAYDCT